MSYTPDEACDPAWVVDVGVQICDALAHEHAHWTWRHDLSPAKLFVVEVGGELVRIELGPRDPRTDMDAALATPSYLAPERACGLADDARSDLYAVGCILFELFEDRPPFVAESLEDLVLKHVMVTPPRARHAPPALAAIIDCLLEKEPAYRYQTVGELREALEAARRAIAPEAAQEARADVRSAA
jgi:serine/threonine-protein kinase